MLRASLALLTFRNDPPETPMAWRMKKPDETIPRWMNIRNFRRSCHYGMDVNGIHVAIRRECLVGCHLATRLSLSGGHFTHEPRAVTMKL